MSKQIDPIVDINPDQELNNFLSENNMQLDEYTLMQKRINVNDIPIFLEYRKHYNIKVKQWVNWNERFDRIQNKPTFLDLDYFFKGLKDRSYQSNMLVETSILTVIKLDKGSIKTIEEYYTENKSFEDITATSTIAKFRKVVKAYIESNKIPKEENSFKHKALTDLLSAYKKVSDLEDQVRSMTIESKTAFMCAKDLWVLHRFEDLTFEEVLSKYKYSISPKSNNIVVSTLNNLIKRFG